PVGPALDQRWPLASPGACHGLGHHFVHGDYVLTVDQHTRNVIGCGPVSNILGRNHDLEAAGHGVLVVFTEEDDRELPDCCQVERFVEGASIACTVAKEGDCDPVMTLELAAQGGTRRCRDGWAQDT